MSDQELKDILDRETVQAAPDSAPEPAPEANDPPPAKAPDVTLKAACGMLVGCVGGIITTRAQVSALTPAEVEALGDSVANVAAQYDLDKLDPKVAAWIGLGITVVGVAAPRIEERQRALMASPAPEDGATEPEAGEGGGSPAPAANDNAPGRSSGRRGREKT